jgi:nitrite reductase/ring-hydroxylating ferredoxin subunit
VIDGYGGGDPVLIDVSGTDGLPDGGMRHLELAGVEVLLARVGGRFYAVGDRCPHEGARLSAGRLDGTIVTCPAHGSRFDVTTGAKVSGPVAERIPGLENLSPRAQALARKKTAEMAKTPVGDLRTYRVIVEGNRVLVDL